MTDNDIFQTTFDTTGLSIHFRTNMDPLILS